MTRTLVLALAAVLIVGVVVPQLAVLLLMVLLLLGVAGLIWSFANPSGRRRRGDRR